MPFLVLCVPLCVFLVQRWSSHLLWISVGASLGVHGALCSNSAKNRYSAHSCTHSCAHIGPQAADSYRMLYHTLKIIPVYYKMSFSFSVLVVVPCCNSSMALIGFVSGSRIPEKTLETS